MADICEAPATGWEAKGDVAGTLTQYEHLQAPMAGRSWDWDPACELGTGCDLGTPGRTMPSRTMASASSQAVSAGGSALGASRGAHPTVRLDSFLKSTDPCYQHAEAPTQGDRFIRKMATYGQIRPSVSFVSEARVVRPMKEHGAMDMSSLPNPVMDPKGDPREGTFEIPAPPPEVDDSFIKMYKNHSLMLPSERYKEHLKMKAGEQKWREERDAVFRYRKRMNVLERKHAEGILGIDGPTHPDSILYKERYEHFATQAQKKAVNAENRFSLLQEKNYTASGASKSCREDHHV
eukprot:Skav215329  [mRNA]  locus=scaffold1391:20087:27921:- [translate_table: standard]